MPPKRALEPMDPNEQRPAKRVNNANSKPKRERTDAKTQFSQRAFEGQYSYICIDRPLWGREDADDPELEHDELPEDEESDRLWQKPAAEHPEWKWVLLKESFEMLNEWCRLAQYCDPDSFGMYVFNDFHGYGLIEILENAFKAFNKELTPYKRPYNFHQMWAIVSTLAQFLNRGVSTPFLMVDDGPRVERMCAVIGCMILTALNEVERVGQLKNDSQFRDLGHVMALYLRFADPTYGTTLDGEEDIDWTHAIVGYAKRAGIDLTEQGVNGMETVLVECEEVVDVEGKAKVDRWGWKNTARGLELAGNQSAVLTSRQFKKYKDDYKTHGMILMPSDTIGGDSYNIVKWSREERAEMAFDKKDPLKDFTDEEIASGNLALN